VEEDSRRLRPDATRPAILVTIRTAKAGADAATVARIHESAEFYANAVRMAGGDPILLRAGDPVPARFDGLLLSGGADVHPRFYGQAIDDGIRETLTIDDARDALEMPLARRALHDDLPILCICRGAQVINVAAGGTLWQDLSLAGISPPHHNQDGRLSYWEYGHEVRVDARSRLETLVGAGTVGVNTYHHQAVADPAPGFVVTARAADGTVEGIESTAHRFVVGVQWHPERLVRHHAVHRGLFEGFVDAARP
jgi:putative glutamine amidotransferase